MPGTTLVEGQTAPPTTLRVGDVIEYRYELLSEVRSGGMGVVWRARDLELERDVTVKEMRFPDILDEEARGILRQRLVAEAEKLAEADHPGLVRVLAVVGTGQAPLVVTESIPGPTLADRIASDGPMTPEATTELGRELADALLAADSVGLHHRFLRPGIVILPDDGPARVTDFGLAALIGDPDVEPSGAVGPTAAAYLAPEHRRVPSGSTSSDVWSLGATLYHAVEGRPPFAAESAKATLDAVATERHPRAENARALAPILDALLTKSAEDRPDLRDVPEIMNATGLLLSGPPLDPSDRMFWRDPLTPNLDLMPEPPPPGAKAAPRPDDPKTRHRRRAVVLAALGVIVLLTTLLAAGGRRTPPRRAASGPVQWVNYTDPASGFQISHPPGWTPERNGTNTDFRDPNNANTALRVGFQRQPSTSPEQVWLDLESRFKTDHPSYERVRLSPTVYAGLDAAVWEFVWTDGTGTDLHNEDLAFNSGSFAFALNFQSTARDWTDQRSLFDRFVASFRPPS